MSNHIFGIFLKFCSSKKICTEKAKIFFEEFFENTSYVISPIVKFGTRDFFSELQSFVKSFSIHKIDRFTTHTDKMKRKV